MRASDADRERVAAILRRHYGAGRLDDDELERRLAKVLGARTLGQLRNQVADLPAPPPSRAHRVAGGVLYTGRALRHPLGIALSVLAALALIGIIAGASGRSSSSGSAASAPVPAVPTSTGTPYSYNPPAEHITQVRTGSSATDDGVKFRVRKVGRRSRWPSTWENQPFLYPTPGHVFAVVDVDYTNMQSSTVSPFCGGGGAKLYSTSHRGYELFERTYQGTGNDVAVRRWHRAAGDGDRVPAVRRAAQLPLRLHRSLQRRLQGRRRPRQHEVADAPDRVPRRLRASGASPPDLRRPTWQTRAARSPAASGAPSRAPAA